MKDYTSTLSEAGKAAPPLSVGGLTLFGIPLPDVVMVMTLIYTIWVIIEKTPKVLDALVNLYRRIRGRN